MQAHFLCLAHNLMILCEAGLARVHGVRNEAEINRRAPWLAKEEQRLAQQNLLLPRLVRTLQRLTVRSVKFIRWLRGATLSLASPRVRHRRPAPSLCRFVGGILDTVDLLCISFVSPLYQEAAARGKAKHASVPIGRRVQTIYRPAGHFHHAVRAFGLRPSRKYRHP